MNPLLLRLALASAGLFFVGGVALRLIPPLPPTVPAAALSDTAAFDPGPGTRDSVPLGSYGPVVENSVFSPDRSAPSKRYVPPGAAEAPPVEPGARAPSRRSTPRLRLVGVALGPMGGVAIIDTNPAIPGADVFRVGDLIGTARVVEIRENAVVLETPGGRMVLTLPPPSRRSP